MKRSLLLLLLLSFGCTNLPYRGNDVVGADEFVIDSYKIKEGKVAVLELEGKTVPKLSEEYYVEQVSTVKNGDVLSVIFFAPKDKELGSLYKEISKEQGFVVANGQVSLPGLGSVEIVGLKLEEAQKKMQQAASHRYEASELFIAYKARPGDTVELTGQVQNTQVIVNGATRLYDVISEAKLSPNADLFRSYVLRQNEMIPVDFYKLLKEGDRTQNIIMKGGDKVYIADASASQVMVLGEVDIQRVIEIPNGFITLKQAITLAGGLSENGDRRYVQVIRGGVLHPKIYSMNWRHVVRLPNDSLMLIPGDIVYVAATPIAEWNRFISKLIPTLIAVDLGRKGNVSVNAGQ